MTRDVIQVGMGPLGRQIARELAQRGLGRIVAAIDRDPELSGRPLPELVPETASDVRILPTIGEYAGSAQVAIVATSSWLEDCEAGFRELLERGLAIVSTCEELSFPWHRHAQLAGALDTLAKRHGGRLLGTGVNPGFLMDALPVMLTAVSRDVRSVEVARVQNASQRRLPFQRKVGLGMTRAEFEERASAGRFGHAGLEESLAFIAWALGFELVSIEVRLEPVIAEREHRCGLASIAPGMVRGLRQTARGATADGRSVALEFVAIAECEDPHDRVRIGGEPALDLRIEGGVHGDVATSAIVLNAIPSLLEAPPGLHTMASIPPARRRGDS